MPLLDVQRRGQQIGRIRIGQQVKAANGRMRPARLDTFRFTTQSRHSADAIAELYGGTVRDWENEFEVITERSAIDVTIPPRDQIISQWYEMWSKGGCARRCDSQREKIGAGPCLCPHATDPDDTAMVEAAAMERARLASLNPPQACEVVTRISVMIPDLPGLGVFRLDTRSYYAAIEIGDAAAVMQVARDRGIFLAATLRIDHRSRVANGKTKKFPVPVLEVIPTFREITSGALEAGGITAQLPPAPGEPRRALAAGPVAPAVQSPAQPVEVEKSPTAQQIADGAAAAKTKQEVAELGKLAIELGVGEDLVYTDTDQEVWEDLKPYLESRWRELPNGGDAA